MDIDRFAVEAGKVVEATGVGVLVVGAIIAAAAFVLRMIRHRPVRDGYQHLRAYLGLAILLGLEFLVSGRWPWQRGQPGDRCGQQTLGQGE